MNTLINKYKVTLIDEPTYSKGSTDNIRSYNTELCRKDEYRLASAHGVIVGDLESPEASVILLGVGGATGVHNESIAHYGNLCFIAAGDAVFSLKVPSLELKWCKKVDFATCFGVYWIESENCLITWGEVDVCRLTATGEIVWTTSGADKFTEGFKIKKDHIELADFNNDKYKVDIQTGKIKRMST
jgi:hypothetical protein